MYDIFALQAIQPELNYLPLTQRSYWQLLYNIKYEAPLSKTYTFKTDFICSYMYVYVNHTLLCGGNKVYIIYI